MATRTLWAGNGGEEGEWRMGEREREGEGEGNINVLENLLQVQTLASVLYNVRRLFQPLPLTISLPTHPPNLPPYTPSPPPSLHTPSSPSLHTLTISLPTPHHLSIHPHHLPALVLRPSPLKCMQTCADSSPSSTVKEDCSRVGAVQIQREHITFYERPHFWTHAV